VSVVDREVSAWVTVEREVPAAVEREVSAVEREVSAADVREVSFQDHRTVKPSSIRAFGKMGAPCWLGLYLAVDGN
jgi:hypothetical protein